MISNYNEFVNEGLGFDKDLMSQILDLNNCVEFREHSITLEEVNLPKYDKYDDNFEKPFKIASRSVRNIIRPIKCLKVLYNGISPYYDNRISMVGIKQEGDNYKVLIHESFAGGKLEDKDIRYMNSQNVIKKSEVVSKIKENVLDHQLRYKNWKEIGRKADEEKRKKYQEDLEKFNKIGINEQFIKDEFAGVFDLCDNHQIPKIQFGMKEISIYLIFKTSPLTKSVSKSASDYRGRGGDAHFDYHSGQMDDQTNDILSELIEVSGRLKDDRNIITYINFNLSGIEVILDITNLK